MTSTEKITNEVQPDSYSLHRVVRRLAEALSASQAFFRRLVIRLIVLEVHPDAVALNLDNDRSPLLPTLLWWLMRNGANVQVTVLFS